MVKLVGTNPAGDTFTVTGTVGVVSGGAPVSGVSGVESTGLLDIVNVTGNTNLYNGISVGDGDDNVTLIDSSGNFIALGEGNNTASLTNGFFYGALSSGAGEDQFTLTDITATAGLASGAGNDTIVAIGDGTDSIGGINTASGDDSVSLDSVIINGTFETGDGADNVAIIDAILNSGLDTGDQADIVNILNSTIQNGIDGGAGDDEVNITGSTLNGGLASDQGNDTIVVDTTLITGGIATGSGSDSVSLVSGTTHGGLSTGSGDDVIEIADGIVFTGILDTGVGNNSLFLPAGTVISDTNGTFTVTEGSSFSLSSGIITLPSGQTINYVVPAGGTITASTICFASGVLIRTSFGEIPVETLRVGDLIETRDNGYKPICWIGKQHLSFRELHLNPRLSPIVIPANAICEGTPHKDLMVSPQHRVLINSRIAQRMFGSSEILVPAVKLLGFGGIFQCSPLEGVCYHHLMLENHEVILSNGASTESLYPGPEALRALNHSNQQELFSLFPDLKIISETGLDCDAAQARNFVKKNKLVKRLLYRHEKNEIALCE